MNPKYYQFCLWLTITECMVALTIALALWVNLMPIWIALPEAEHLNVYEKYVTSGYGFWGAMWAIPNYVMLTADIDSRRKWALLAGCAYALWWLFWWDQLWNGTWQWYVIVLYVPVRIYQVAANLAYGLLGPKL